MDGPPGSVSCCRGTRAPTGVRPQSNLSDRFPLAFKINSKRRRILIAEDDWAILEVLKLMLEHEGHVVVTAKNGREAVALATAKPFDMIVMDISMPEMSGIEVARALRARDETANILIGIHTGLDEHWVRERFADYDLFLTKATDTDVLIDEIARLFAQPAAARADRATAATELRFSSDEVVRAQQALRTEMGLGSEAMPSETFIAMLAGEIDQLRRIDKSDAEIAALISGAIDRDIPLSLIRR